MKMSEGNKGKAYRITEIKLDSAVVRRLYTLGMTYGSLIYILNQKNAGPMIIKVRGTRFALGRRFCKGIFVEEEQ